MNTKIINKVVIGAGLALLAGSAVAADTTTLGGIATNVQGSVQSIKSLILNLFYLAGLFLFGSGLFLLYKDQKQPNQGHAKNGAIASFVGVSMLLIPTLVNYFSGTMGLEEAGTKITTTNSF